MHKVFVSYHDANDSVYKDRLLELNNEHGLFIDVSVDTDDIDDTDLLDQTIREIIRDDYLADATVTIVLVGTDTWRRKHVDWEIYSSMYDGAKNKKSGIIAIMLPSVDQGYVHATHQGEKDAVYADITNWTNLASRAEYEQRYLGMPDRIIDNLIAPKSKVSVTSWKRVEDDPQILALLIELSHRDRAQCEYDLSRAMRRANG